MVPSDALHRVFVYSRLYGRLSSPYQIPEGNFLHSFASGFSNFNRLIA
jgi:hypothetical protein